MLCSSWDFFNPRYVFCPKLPFFVHFLFCWLHWSCRWTRWIKGLFGIRGCFCALFYKLVKYHMEIDVEDSIDTKLLVFSIFLWKQQIFTSKSSKGFTGNCRKQKDFYQMLFILVHFCYCVLENKNIKQKQYQTGLFFFFFGPGLSVMFERGRKELLMFAKSPING